MSIYVDLDGTLAEYSGTFVAGHIGKPIQRMMIRVREWLAKGETVVIFTARACNPDEVSAVRTWLYAHDLPDLQVTNIKGFDGLEFWDDRAIRVEMNTGRVLPYVTNYQGDL